MALKIIMAKVLFSWAGVHLLCKLKKLHSNISFLFIHLCICVFVFVYLCICVFAHLYSCICIACLRSLFPMSRDHLATFLEYLVLFIFSRWEMKPHFYGSLIVVVLYFCVGRWCASLVPTLKRPHSNLTFSCHCLDEES